MTRVVLVHERFTERAGSEKVVEEFGRIWPDARIFAPIADPATIGPSLGDHPLTVSPLQRLYRNDGRYTHLLPLLPWAMGQADLSDADLVVVSHHAFGNRIKPAATTPVLSYVHSPARWMWDPALRDLELGTGPAKSLLAAFARSQTEPDRRAAARVDLLVANSTAVAERIEQWWGLESTVVAPPVDVDYYTPDTSLPRDDFLLLAGRLVPYKRPQIAVAAATAAGLPLVVAGQGRAFEACRAVAGPNVTFIGDPTDAGLRDLFRRCRGLVFPGVEDFGIVPVEAQACGAPVLGVDIGGLRDTVIPGETGVLVPHHDDPDNQIAELADAMRSFPDFDHLRIRLRAEAFGAARFRKEIEALAAETFSSS